ncbi:uncharacterized protein LOC131927247 [Physella acuta]|uniref:uncharacterized protein LOC131927247 n=1 Tax=Physella acuta TaxID=109671 RepID=UPI0027DCA42A|nr:uncharacterized protein LOC131927247 [Physella acuta]
MNTPYLLAFAAILVLLGNTSAKSVDTVNSEVERDLDETFAQSLERALELTKSNLQGSKRFDGLQRRKFLDGIFSMLKGLYGLAEKLYEGGYEKVLDIFKSYTGRDTPSDIAGQLAALGFDEQDRQTLQEIIEQIKKIENEQGK